MDAEQFVHVASMPFLVDLVSAVKSGLSKLTPLEGREFTSREVCSLKKVDGTGCIRVGQLQNNPELQQALADNESCSTANVNFQNVDQQLFEPIEYSEFFNCL